jgi:hypothetical protein
VSDLDLEAIKARLELMGTFPLATDCRDLVTEVERLRAALLDWRWAPTRPSIPRSRAMSDCPRYVPPPDHRIAWTIEGDWITGKLTCSAHEGAACRLVCEQGCETWPCTGDGHKLVDNGSCNAAEWINETGPEEAHGGDSPATLHDGPVDVWWSGTSWRWAYRKDPVDA